MSTSTLRPINPNNHATFVIDEPALIRHHLQQLIDRHELVGLYTALDSTQFALSSILDCDERSVWLDIPADKLVGKRLEESGSAIVVAHAGNIHSQFSAEGIQTATQGGKPALRCALPTSLMYVQRRDAYRQRIPLREPLTCLVPLAGHEDVALAVADISVNGIGLLGFAPELTLRKGLTLQGCKINLPGCGLLVADLAIQSVAEYQLRQQIPTLRTGCSFLSLAAGAQNMVMRYITRIERERLQQSR
ncbi:flagellar brake protein [Chitinilyticum piscinae]|uniref:Flagellar brake protein YcgR n=1 Tax=Chitinilyticum piscinae TaxID=2866724 RepID=A0A8J7FP28_9NEIS|nr:flagellar brake protein [Chitinilyticum piscinae]MBE9607896.1 flagellar brake protein [Chitinilyticum piscinae]